MSKKALVAFFEKEVADAKEKDILFSLHLKVRTRLMDPTIPVLL
jgi:isocitrate dehydrogenase